ncbi:TonB-dependent receptor plug domain-containing protein [Flavobacterium sp. DGU38]|uniref:TonB-dependent receptor plug domain-containing protein n=1 Tax=Flavobacterium calami TaxID=3139144 RepID=A0ABU9IRL7_9FLAO
MTLNFKPKGSLNFFAIVFSFQFLSAQYNIQNDTLKSNLLQEVEISSGSKTKTKETIKIDVLDVKDLRNTSVTLGDAINRMSGIRIRETGGLGSSSTIFLNGFTGRSVKYFKDDIPIDYLGESFNVLTLPTTFLNRVEIYKGILPSNLGADALGGAINFVTQNNNKKHFNLSYEYGSFNTNRFTMNLFSVSNSKKYFAGIDGFYNHSDNDYRVNVKIVDPQTATLSEKNVRRFHDKFANGFVEVYGGIKDKFYADELKVGITFTKTRKDQQHGALMTNPYGQIYIKESVIAPTINYKKAFLNHKLLFTNFNTYSVINSKVIDTCGCSYDWYGNKTVVPAREGEADADGSLSDIDFKNFINRTFINYSINDFNKLTFNLVYSDQSRKGTDPYGPVYFFSGRDILSVPATYKKLVISLGWESKYLRDKLTNNLIIKSYNFETDGVDGGLSNYKEETVKNKGTHYGASESIKYAINEKSFLRAGFENAYRLPEQGELYGDGQFLLSNFNLKPEQSLNINFGYRYDSGSKSYFETSIFYRKTENLIILVPVFLPFSQYSNVNKVKGYGVEIDGGCEIIKNLNINGNLTYQDLRLFGISDPAQKFLNDARLRNTPFLFGNLSLDFNKKNVITEDDAFRSYYNYSYTLNYYLANVPKSSEPSNIFGKPKINTDLVIPTQHLHSVGIVYSFKNEKINLGFEVRNLFDEKLYDNFKVQKAGRGYYLKIRYLFY